MSIRTTVTLDGDVVERVKSASKARGESFRVTINELLRFALVKQAETPPPRRFKVRATAVGLRPGLSYDKISELLEIGEGPYHR